MERPADSPAALYQQPLVIFPLHSEPSPISKSTEPGCGGETTADLLAERRETRREGSRVGGSSRLASRSAVVWVG